MASLDDIAEALRRADAAGHEDDARALAQAYRQAQQSQAAPQQETQPQPDMATDAARSIPGGLAKGAAAIAGFPGDLVSLGAAPQTIQVAPGQRPSEAIAKPETALQRFDQNIAPQNILPRSKTIEGWLSGPFGGFYEPKTTAGRYAETIASMAAGGEGGLVKRALRAGAAGAASEGAGDLAQAAGAPGAVPYAKAIGAGLGGALHGVGEGLAAERQATRSTMTTQQVKNSANYGAFSWKPVQMTPEATTALSDRVGQTAIRKALNEAQINQEPHLVQEFQALLAANPAARPGQVSTEAADKIRQAFDTLASKAGSPNEARGWESRSDAMETAIQQTPEINDARNAWGRYRRSQILDKAMSAAEEAAGTPAGFGDKAQAIRREFLKVVRSKKFDAFTPDEQTAIKSVANGTATSNTLQQLGKFSPVRGHITRWLELGGALSGHAPESLGLAALGEAARQGSNFASARGARLASELVRSGGLTVPQIARPTARDAMLAGVLGFHNVPNDYAARISDLAPRSQ